MTSLQTPATVVELDVQGMTCTSCAARIEKKLNRLDGVTATVNYATEKATVQVRDGVQPGALIATIEQAGYGATLPVETVDEHDRELRALRRRLIISTALSVPVIVMSIVPALQFPGWQWVSLLLSLVVVGWAGWPFHRATLINLRHGQATMDTLISVGTVAALGWSVYAMVTGAAGEIGFRHDFEFRLVRHDGTANLYLEAAVGTTTFLLARTVCRAAGQAPSRCRTARPARTRRARCGGAAERCRATHRDRSAPGRRSVRGPTWGEDRDRRSDRLRPQCPGHVHDHRRVDAGRGRTGRSGGGWNHQHLWPAGRRGDPGGGDTQLAQIARLVEAAQAGKASVQRLADKISAIFVPIVMAIAVATLGFWLGQGSGPEFAFTAAVAVLIIACPCALGSGHADRPLVGTGRGAQLGILIKGPEVLEHVRRIDTVVLDKTGTVTSGRMTVVAVMPRRASTSGGDGPRPAPPNPHRSIPLPRPSPSTRAAGPVRCRQLHNRPGFGVVAVSPSGRSSSDRSILAGERGHSRSTAESMRPRAGAAAGRTAVAGRLGRRGSRADRGRRHGEAHLRRGGRQLRPAWA